MWIRDIDIPKELIEAQQKGELVLFVGAGASRSDPASLPDFKALASDIADEANVAVSEEDLEQPDVLLGDLEDSHDVDVHVRVAARLGNPTSEPNRLHEAICALSISKPPARIVTTNYDRHLSRVLEALDHHPSEYHAPALPMGDNFTGLVYLHGSLQQDPAELVITDADFGRAYLRDAWATRFLERMFATYKVLFIGYSHGDVVMRYLARGLGPDKRRFVLSDDTETSNWRRLFVKPIGYPNPDGLHDSLVEGIEGWAEWSSMGLLDHRQRIAQLVSSNPSSVPEEQSYTEETLSDPDRVSFFVEYAEGEKWLTWAAMQPEFKALFGPGFGGSECSMTLATWFAEKYAINEDFSSLALAVTQQLGGRIGSHLHEAIGLAVHRSPQPRPDWLSPWLILLMQNGHSSSTHWLDYALRACRWPDNRNVAMTLLDHLLEPRVELQPRFGSDDGVRMDVKLRGDDHWLTEAWTETFAPKIGEAYGELLPIVEGHLRRVHQVQAVFGSLRPGWDPVSYSRSAIEPHDQDTLRWPVDILIDIARDSLEAALTAADSTGVGYLHSWSQSNSALLRRLAVHGWAIREDVEPTQKVEWLLEREWLYDRQLRHEVFRLLAEALAETDQTVADALVAQAVGGPSGEERDVRDYEVFNLLTWIVGHAPDLESAGEVLGRVAAEHEEFEEREHPDLLSWSFSGSWAGNQPPLTNDAFHGLIENDLPEAIQEILQYEGSSPPFDKPTWSDALSLVSSTVRAFPRDGLIILDSDLGTKLDIRRAVINGWSRAELSTDEAQNALEKLGELDLAPIVDDVASLLSETSNAEGIATEWHQLAASREIASRLWEAIVPEDFTTDDTNWLHRAINHPAGKLSQYWLHALSSAWREAGDSWSGIPDDFQTALEGLTDGDDLMARLAEVIFTSQLHFLFAADSAWCIEHVLPILDWSDPTRAKAGWDGYLTRGRWSDRVLEAGLLDRYLEAAAHIGEFNEETQRRLCGHLASIGVHSEVETTEWFRDFTANVEPDTRTEWLDQVAVILREIPPDAVESQWNRWMRNYWIDRLASIPNVLTHEESSALARWAIYMTDSLPEAVDLAVSSPAGVSPHSTFLMDLKEPTCIARAPEAIARLLTHVLTGTEPPFWECHNVAEAVPILGEYVAAEDIAPIREEALRLGCAGAGDW